jgi:hypothetical protein
MNDPMLPLPGLSPVPGRRFRSGAHPRVRRSKVLKPDRLYAPALGLRA